MESIEKNQPNLKVFTIESLQEWLKEDPYYYTCAKEKLFNNAYKEHLVISIRIEQFLEQLKHVEIAEKAVIELLHIDLSDEFIFLKWCWKYRNLGEQMINFWIEYILGSEYIENQLITVADGMNCTAEPYLDMIFISYIYLELSTDTLLEKETIDNVQKMIKDYIPKFNPLF